MMRIMCKSKIHRATVTQKDLHYQGSITIDAGLMERANLLPFEQVQVVNVTTGARFETYAIPGERNSGVIGLNGAAARLAELGDLVIIMSFALCTDAEARALQPAIVLLGAGNRLLDSASVDWPALAL